MIDRRRVVAAVPHLATIVPKGARRQRDEIFRTSVAVDIEVVPDPPVAVIVRDRGMTVSYQGHAGALWLPVRPFGDPNQAPLGVEELVDCLAVGRRPGTTGEIDNPFLRLCREPLSPDMFRRLGAVEDRILKSIEGDDRAEVAAAAGRVADDFLFTTGGAVLRRSPGPFWGAYARDRLGPVACQFDIPLNQPDQFAFHRLDEAIEFHSNVGLGRVDVSGAIEIVDADCVPDRDAEFVARSIFRKDVAAWFETVMPVASPEVRALGERSIEAFERIHGLPLKTMADVRTRSRPTPAGALPPTPIEIVEGVDALCAFVHGMPGGDEPELNVTCASWKSLFVGMTGLAVRRFDAHERHRLPDPEGIPDLATPWGAAP